MLELAVANGVKLILLTTHSECAAERAAADPAQRQRYPALTRSVLERGRRLRELLARPFLAAKIQSGELLVKQLDIDTRTELLLPH
jgi:carbonic anhydrase